jgi:hypothetical protein
MIDTDSGDVQGVIQLTGRNPVDIAVSNNKERLYVANMAQYDDDLDGFDLTTAYGGIEIIDLDTEETILMIDDEDLGGYVERLTVSDDKVFAVVSRFDSSEFTYVSKIVAFPQDMATASEVVTWLDFDFDTRDFFVQNDILWLSKRVINSSSGISEAKLGLYQISTADALVDDLSLDVAATSLAGE